MAFGSFALFWNRYHTEVNAAHQLKEAELQRDLAHCPGHCSSSEERETRETLRLLRNSAAARPFFHHNPFLTDCSGFPIIHALEKTLLRVFIGNFHQVEHRLIRQMGIRLKDWATTNSYRDQFSSVLVTDPVLYRRVLFFESALPSAQIELSRALQQAILSERTETSLAA
jgi:hypothetical protein